MLAWSLLMALAVAAPGGWEVVEGDGFAEYRLRVDRAPVAVVYPPVVAPVRYVVAVDGSPVRDRAAWTYLARPVAVTADPGERLSLRVYEGPPPGSPLDVAQAAAQIEQQRQAALSLRFLDPYGTGLFLITALYHLQMFRRRTRERAYLWFSLVCVGALGVNLTGMATFAPPFDVPATLFTLVNLGSASLAVASFVVFARVQVGLPSRRVVAALAGVMVVTTVLATALGEVGPLVLVWLSGLVMGTAAFARAAWRGDPEGRTLVAGIGAFAVLLAASIVLDTLEPDPQRSGALALAGFTVLVLSMAISLSNRFERTHRELDQLRLDLEARVAHRTAQLAEANAALQGFNEQLSSRVAAQVGELLRQRRLWRFFPKAVREHLLTGDEEVVPTTERRTVTILFADLTGYTVFSEGVAPEQATATVNLWITAMVEEIEAHGGIVDKIMGDGIMALWGATDPASPVEQAQGAVRGAFAMQRAMAQLRDRWAEAGVSHRFDLRVGVHQDVVAVGNVGTEELMSFTAIGRGVNLAARLESSCPPGRVQVSASLARRLPPELCRGEPAERQLKGVASPVAVLVLEPPAPEPADR